MRRGGVGSDGVFVCGVLFLGGGWTKDGRETFMAIGDLADLVYEDTRWTYVVALMRRSCAVVLAYVLYGVCRPDDLCRPILPFRRPHCAVPDQ